MQYLMIIPLIISFTVNIEVKSHIAIDLWNVTLYDNNKFVNGFETKVPAGSYTGAVKNIYWNDNDVKYRYIANCTTSFSTEFVVSDFDRDVTRFILVFHGVDTYATIKLNDREVGTTSNMFTRYIFDVKDYFITPKNLLNVTIHPAVKIAEEIYNNQSKNYVVYPKCVPDAYNGECHVNHIRKMQASFGWDWGPAIPSSGIWRDVEIIPIRGAHLMDYTVDVYQVDKKDWKVNVTVLLEMAPSSSSKPISVDLQITLQNTNPIIMKKERILIQNNEKEIMKSIILDVPENAVLRWWPNGYGAQHLYNVVIRMDTANSGNTQIKRIGFRTVELVQEPLGKGLSFYFRVNGVPIFAKGSNVIPINIAPEKSTNYMYVKNLLWSAKEVHMNMLRVWGGGVYGSEEFYNMADALGIMIWQDFMFACAMYPVTPDFLDSVKEEVRQNVWKLKSHPSVVLWAGNNENEAALYGNWYGTGKDQIYRDDYIKLYVDVIKTEVERLDHTRPFIVSSPSNGLWADENGWIGTDPYSNFYGDIHYYNYINDGWNINNYPCPRFSSEYGFQSFPSIHTLEPVTENATRDLAKDSEFIQHRQHLPNGNQLMEMMIAKNFKIPSSNKSRDDFENYIYLSQVNQAQSMKVQTESYRQTRSTFNDIGEGYTMGALYWQLNDVWQAPTWSSIDINGRWKILHNYAKDFFAPIIISPRLSLTNDLAIFIISDKLKSRHNCLAQIVVHKIYTGDQPNAYIQSFKNVTVRANSSYKLTTINLEDILKSANCGNNFYDAKRKCLIELILKDSDGENIAPPNYVYPTSPKNLDLPSCGVIINVEYADENTNGYRLTIHSRCTLMFVWFDLPGYMVGKFSENGFHVLQGSKTIYFNNSPYYIDITKFTRKLRVTTLGDIYITPRVSHLIICGDCMF